MKQGLPTQNSNEWQLAPEPDMSIPQGAGAIVAHPKDLRHILELPFNYKIVSEKTCRQ